MEPDIAFRSNLEKTKNNVKYVKIPLNISLQINSIDDFNKIGDMIDKYIGSDEFKKKFFGERPKEYVYIPQIRPRDDSPADAQ